jgi:hypothetical protein
MKTHPGFQNAGKFKFAQTWVVTQSTTAEAGSVTYPSTV